MYKNTTKNRLVLCALYKIYNAPGKSKLVVGSIFEYLQDGNCNHFSELTQPLFRKDAQNQG